MQPYQEASQSILSQKDEYGNLLKKGAGIGLSLVGGGAVLKRIVPLLSKLVPSGMAAKGLAKIDPRFGKFVQGAMDTGYTQEDALNFLREKLEESPEREIETGPKVKPPSSKDKGEAVKKFNEHKKKNSIVDELHQQFQQQYGGQQMQQPVQPQQPDQPQQGQQGNSDEMLLAALQKILQM